METGFKAACLALLFGAVCAGNARADVFQRGDYRFSTGAEPAFVTRVEIPAVWPSDAAGADDARWRYWLYDLQTDHRGPHDVTYVEEAFEVRAASLLGDAGRVQIGFMPDFQTLTIHRVEIRRDGRWSSRLDPARVSLARREGQFEEDVANGSVTALIVLDDVRVGDIVRVAYSTDGSNPVLSGQDTDWFHVSYRNPVLDLRWRALYAPGTRLAIHTERTTQKPEIAARADAVEARFAAHGVPASTDAGDYPRWYEIFPAFQLGPERRWADVVNWALPLYPDVTTPLPADLEARITAWRALPDSAARLTAVLRAVQDEVRYFGIEMGETTHRPHPPADTWSRRFGDCKDKAYLLATVLRRLDIPAVPALVSTAHGRAVDGYLPGGDAFDHVIVRARLGDATVWVDPTIAQQGGDPRRYDMSELGVALPIASGVGALEPIPVPPEAENGVDAVERYESNADGSAMTFTVDTTYRGAAADGARRGLANQRAEDLSRQYAEYYGKRYRGLTADGLPKVDDDRIANVVRVHERYRLASPFEDKGSGTRSLDGFAEAVSGPTSLPNSMGHVGPLLVGRPGHFRHEVQVVAPAAWSPRFGREDESHESPAFRFTREAEVDASTTKLVYDLDIRQHDVAAADVGAYLEALRALREDLSFTLRYQMPAALGQKQREDRLKALLRDAVDGDKK